MADNFSNVPFPISGSSIEVKLNYQLNLTTKEKKKLNLLFKFLIVENTLTPTTIPTVADLYNEFDKFLLKRLLFLFGKNVQLTSVSIKCAGLSFVIPLYLFGLSDTNSLPSDTALFFLLQPYGKSTSYRLYLKGCCTSFAQRPISTDNLSKIQEFESLFTKNLVYLNGLLVLKVVRGNDQLISVTFRELKKFKPRKALSSSRRGLKGSKAVKKRKSSPKRKKATATVAV